MSHAEIEAKWTARLGEWRALGVHVIGEKVATEILEDLRSISTAAADETLTLVEAAALTNYHPESIGRLVRAGKVHNYGTKHRPRVKLAELPKKTSSANGHRSRKQRAVAENAHSSSSSRVVSIDTIARDAVAGRIGRP